MFHSEIYFQKKRKNKTKQKWDKKYICEKKKKSKNMRKKKKNEIPHEKIKFIQVRKSKCHSKNEKMHQ